MRHCKKLASGSTTKNILLFASILFTLIPVSLFAQLSDTKIKSAYTYQFAQNIEWPSEQSIDSFRIDIYTENLLLIKDFKDIARTRTIKNRPISIRKISRIEQINDRTTNILYVDKVFNDNLPKLFLKIEYSPVLVVTEESDLKNQVMINFIYTDNKRTKVGFEVNRNAIENQQKLKILPKLLLLGGSKLDVAELYEKQEVKLNDAQSEVEKYQREIENQKILINSQKTEIDKQKGEILNQKKDIQDQQLLLESQKNSLDTLIQEIVKQNKVLAENLVVIKQHQQEIDLQQKQKVLDRKEMAIRNEILDKQKAEIQSQQQKIDGQRNILTLQQKKIQVQNWFLMLSVAVVLLTLSLIFFIYRVLRNKQRANILLEEKNLAIQLKNFEIEKQNEEIEIQAKILDDTNKELEQHNLQLEEIVQERTNEYKKAKEKAEESDNLKSAFLANMSHEIRTPLNAIVGFSEILSREVPEDSSVQQFIDIIKQSSQDLLVIINDIIDIAKIESEQLQVNIINCDIYSELEGVYSIYSELISKNDKYKNIQLLYTPDNRFANHFIIKTDTGRIKQIFNNFLSNALKFTKTGTIQFGYKVLESEVEFFVSDTGIGIPLNLQGAIFQRFRKINQDDEYFFSGTGLGLAISKSLVELLGGRIWFNSEPGVGTKFSFTIPLSEGEVSYERNNHHIHDSISFPGRTILLCEDDFNSRELMKIHLSSLEFNIIEAIDGEDAIAKFKANPNIDLVLLDIQMPRLDGYKTLIELRKISNGKLPIIAQTAFAMTQDIEKIVESGFDDFISKPIIFDKLTEVLEKGLRK